VSLTYRSKKLSEGDLWGYGIYGIATWNNTAGYSIDIDNNDYKIVKLGHDIDKFESDVTLRSV